MEHDVIVMKFGGTSVGDAARIAEVASLVTAEQGDVVVVVSAMGGTTDVLLEAGRAAERGDLDGALEQLKALRTRHLAVAQDADVVRTVEALLEELEDLLRGVSLLREQTARSRAMLASFGERLSIPLVAEAVQRAGRTAVAVDARTFLVTDERHEAGVVDVDESTQRAKAKLLPLLGQGCVPVVTGFVAATKQGVTTVLGRGGSDYTAALVGAMLDATEIWIWTDVNGILSADPRIVRDARTLEQVSFREAAEMSYFGAKVVHPKTMMPAMERGIPLRIRSTFQPTHPGTRVASETMDVPFGVKTVTSVRRQVLLSVEGRGMAGIPGVARRIFGCAEDASVNVVMISRASSEQTVSFVVDAADSQRLVSAIGAQFALELKAGLLDPVRIVEDVAVVSAIGQGMAGHVGTSARLFTALGRTGVNVLAIAQGASELSISAAILESDAVRAVRAVHAAFGLTRLVDVFVVGAGRVATSYLKMLAKTQSALVGSHRVELRLLGIANRKACVLEADGVDPSTAIDRLAHAPARPCDADLLDALDAARHGPVIVVDLTAGDLVELHRSALDRAFHVVTANKVPLSGSGVSHKGLVDAIRRTGAHYGYETTFGAGLPVLHTLKELLHTGDTVASVSGCFSGTLGFLCTKLQDGVPLADAVAEAAELGYTEPDPREDLSGRDVARKALIIARAIGLELEPEDVHLQSLVPDLEGGLEQAMATHGPALSARIAAAAAAGSVIRYVATITPERVEVGPLEVAADSPIGSLRGPDNILVFRTARYRDYPLVVRGPGAGAEVTAAGVLGDTIRVASGTR